MCTLPCYLQTFLWKYILNYVFSYLPCYCWKSKLQVLNYADLNYLSLFFQPTISECKFSLVIQLYFGLWIVLFFIFLAICWSFSDVRRAHKYQLHKSSFIGQLAGLIRFCNRIKTFENKLKISLIGREKCIIGIKKWSCVFF